MNLIAAQRGLILGCVALTPIFNAGELLEALRGAPLSQVTAVTPIYVKLIKDVVFVAIILLGLVICQKTVRLYGNAMMILFLFVCVSGLVVSIYTMPRLLLASGLRTLLPIVAIFFIWRAVDTRLQRDLALVLVALFAIGLLCQILQLFFFPPFWGTNPLGLNLRNPGFFIIPSTMGSFSCLAAYYAYCYLPANFSTRFVVFVAFPISVILTASAATLLSMVAMFAVIAYFRVRERPYVLLFFGLALLGFALMLPEIVGRADIYKSLEDRVGILALNFELSRLMASDTFGMATNTGVALVNTLDIPGIQYKRDVIISDSTLIAFMLNFGLLSSCLFVLAWASVFSKTAEYGMFMAIVTVFSLTVVVVESFPLNMLLAVNFVYLHYLKTSRRIAAAPSTAPRHAPAAPA